MANILERYGIKEVADVTFIDLKTGVPVLYLDTLKISTIEETAEQAEARGGKGNAPLIVWDYGKEITLNITDALYSPKSMALMHSSNLGNLNVYEAGSAAPVVKYKNFKVVADTDVGKKGDYITLSEAKALFKEDELKDGEYVRTVFYKLGETVSSNTPFSKEIARKLGLNTNEMIIDNSITGVNKTTTINAIYNPERNVRGGIHNSATPSGTANGKDQEIKVGNTYTLEYQVYPESKSYIEISADGFPGTYKVVGDTWARGKGETQDQYFQFEIAEAKISAETTITLEAEGDPSVFEMTLRVLRPDNGKMMKLIQYDFNTVDSDNDDVTHREYTLNGSNYEDNVIPNYWTKTVPTNGTTPKTGD